MPARSFSDGMHEDILTNLANIRELRVVSRTSVMQYRDTTKTMPQIARELGVAYILEGSVRRAGNKVRVTGQLIHAATDEHLWAKSYDRELTPKEMFAIQAALSTEIAGALQAAISPETKSSWNAGPTGEPRGLRSLPESPNVGTRPRPRRSQGTGEKLLQGAVDLDPNFAEAWGELAVVHARHGIPRLRPHAGAAGSGRCRHRAGRPARPEAPEVIRLLARHL